MVQRQTCIVCSFSERTFSICYICVLSICWAEKLSI